MTTPAALQASLHARIPLSRAMDVTVLQAVPGQVVLRAPLEPNINHSGTVFGGSAAAVATLAAWATVEVGLQAAGQAGRIVIRRSAMDFGQPVVAAFTARGLPPEEADWERLRATLRRGRMGRITVRSVLECSGQPVGEFEGEFAVIPE